LDLGGGEMDESLEGLDAVRNLAGRDSKKFAELLRNWLR
jgi:flagellar biosynthesis/type III secretory pathway M-ring protein FliF/YscJ